MIANIKNTADVKIGDTITLHKVPCKDPSARIPLHHTRSCLQGSIRSTQATSRPCAMRLGKLQLNDSALHIEQESSLALRLWLPLRLPRAAPS